MEPHRVTIVGGALEDGSATSIDALWTAVEEDAARLAELTDQRTRHLEANADLATRSMASVEAVTKEMEAGQAARQAVEEDAQHLRRRVRELEERVSVEMQRGARMVEERVLADKAGEALQRRLNTEMGVAASSLTEMATRFAALEGTNEEGEQRLDEAREELRGCRSALAASGEREALQATEIGVLQQKLVGLQCMAEDHLEHLSEGATRHQETIATMDVARREAAAALQEAHRKKHTEAQRAAHLTGRVGALGRQYSDLEASLAAQIDDHQAVVNALESEAATRQQEILDLTEARAEAEAARAETEQRLGSVEGQKAELAKTLAAAEEARDAAAEEGLALKEALDVERAQLAEAEQDRDHNGDLLVAEVAQGAADREAAAEVEKFHLKLAEMAALGKSLLEKMKKIEKNNASLKEENASLKEENASLKAKVESQEHRAYEESEEDNIQTKKVTAPQNARYFEFARKSAPLKNP